MIVSIDTYLCLSPSWSLQYLVWMIYTNYSCSGRICIHIGFIKIFIHESLLVNTASLSVSVCASHAPMGKTLQTALCVTVV